MPKIDRKLVQRWVIAANSAVILLLAFGLYNRYRQLTTLWSLRGVPVHTGEFIQECVPAFCVIAWLLIGIAVELRQWKPAWLINAGFYWLVFLPTLWKTLTYRGPHPDEIMLVVIMVLTPSGILALVTSGLYFLHYKTRNLRETSEENSEI